MFEAAVKLLNSVLMVWAMMAAARWKEENPLRAIWWLLFAIVLSLYLIRMDVAPALKLFSPAPFGELQ